MLSLIIFSWWHVWVCFEWQTSKPSVGYFLLQAVERWYWALILWNNLWLYKHTWYFWYRHVWEIVLKLNSIPEAKSPSLVSLHSSLNQTLVQRSAVCGRTVALGATRVRGHCAAIRPAMHERTSIICVSKTTFLYTTIEGDELGLKQNWNWKKCMQVAHVMLLWEIISTLKLQKHCSA